MSADASEGRRIPSCVLLWKLFIVTLMVSLSNQCWTRGWKERCVHLMGSILNGFIPLFLLFLSRVMIIGHFSDLFHERWVITKLVKSFIKDLFPTHLSRPSKIRILLFKYFLLVQVHLQPS